MNQSTWRAAADEKPGSVSRAPWQSMAVLDIASLLCELPRV
jgi:hypothetical protein